MGKQLVQFGGNLLELVTNLTLFGFGLFLGLLWFESFKPLDNTFGSWEHATPSGSHDGEVNLTILVHAVISWDLRLHLLKLLDSLLQIRDHSVVIFSEGLLIGQESIDGSVLSINSSLGLRSPDALKVIGKGKLLKLVVSEVHELDVLHLRNVGLWLELLGEHLYNY